jgi:hypothetical protein
MLEGMDFWSEKKEKPSEEFHLDPSKEVDPAEILLEREGQEGAVAELEERLKVNPNDTEARRQLDLIHNRLSDLLERIGRIIHH